MINPLSRDCRVLFKHLHLHDIFLCCFWCWTHRPSSFPLLGWLRGFIQSKLSTALDDPWPTGRVEGSARTPLPIHVSQCHSIIDTHTQTCLPLWTLQTGPWLIHVFKQMHCPNVEHIGTSFCLFFSFPILASDNIPKFSSHCTAQASLFVCFFYEFSLKNTRIFHT